MRGLNQPFPAQLGKSEKRHLGRTEATLTPLNLRTEGVSIDDDFEEYIRDRAGEAFSKFARHAERVTVRFEDINGPKGGVDTDCRIKIVLSSAPSIFVAKRGDDAKIAFDMAIDAAERALRRAVGRRGWNHGTIHDAELNDLLAQVEMEEAVARERESHRTSRPRASAPTGAYTLRAPTDGAAPRNEKRSAPKATASLEASAKARPSRKSTRASANRSKRDSPQRLAKLKEVYSPTAIAERNEQRRK